MKKILYISILWFFCGCSTSSVDNFYNRDEMVAVLEKSDHHRSRLRQQAELYTLEEKALYFERTLLAGLHSKIKLVPQVITSDTQAVLRLDMSALLLGMLATKYHVLNNAEDKALIKTILDNIITSDVINGYDGFIPFKVKIINDTLEVVSNKTHANVYVQLFFSYYQVLFYVDDESIQKQVKQHLRLILWHFIQRNYVLFDQEGLQAKYSDLSPRSLTVHHNRQLSLLSLLDFGLYALDCYPNVDQMLVDTMIYTRKQIMHLGYTNTVCDLHWQFMGVELPTHSSSWLNFLKIYTGSCSSSDPLYKRAYQSLYEHYADEHNPWFELIGLYVLKPSADEAKQTVSRIKKVLATYPIDLTDHEVINSKSITTIRAHSNYIKLQRIIEAAEPLPIYQRPLNSYEWKSNQMRLDGNFHSKGQRRYTGIDYMQLYWLLRALEMQLEQLNTHL